MKNTTTNWIFKFAFFSFLSLFLSQSTVSADLVEFDLTTEGIGGQLSDFQTVTLGGITLNASAESVITGGTDAVFNANGATGGVDTVGVTGSGGDSPSVIDVSESLTFEFTFSDSLNVILGSIDLQGVGSASTQDQAFLDFDGVQIALGSGVDGFDGTLDTFEFSPPLTLSSGDSIRLTAEDQIGIQAIRLQVTSAVPEPTSSAILLLVAISSGAVRRRAA
jgi:hypothetical protein